MSQPESGHSDRMICPVCEKEGQRITCTSGSRSEVIVYHPKKRCRTVCHIPGNGNMDNKAEEIDNKGEKEHEADIVETR